MNELTKSRQGVTFPFGEGYPKIKSITKHHITGLKMINFVYENDGVISIPICEEADSWLPTRLHLTLLLNTFRESGKVLDYISLCKRYDVETFSIGEEDDPPAFQL